MRVAKLVAAQLQIHRIPFNIIRDYNSIVPIAPDTILITLGGDGTILHSVSSCVQHDIPIFGINVGNLGFLTEIEVEQIPMAIQAIKLGNYTIEKRKLLQCDCNNKTHIALNEVVFFRNTPRLINVQLTISNVMVEQYSGDGLIVATPTGSTAYSLSCGGSIINPETPVLALTPVNPHTLRCRPLIVGDHNTVQVSLGNQATSDIIVDGNAIGILTDKMILRISSHNKCAKFVRIQGCDTFYNKLAKKLKNP
jgi:NAD+ kinase